MIVEILVACLVTCITLLENFARCVILSSPESFSVRVRIHVPIISRCGLGQLPIEKFQVAAAL